MSVQQALGNVLLVKHGNGGIRDDEDGAVVEAGADAVKASANFVDDLDEPVCTL